MHNAVESAVAQGAGHRYIRRMMGFIVPPFSLSLAASFDLIEAVKLDQFLEREATLAR